jgi:hypothetical protein
MRDGLSLREMARQVGVSRPAVAKAQRSYLLDLTSDGKIDPAGPNTVAWLESHKRNGGKGNVVRLAGNRGEQLTERAASLHRENTIWPSCARTSSSRLLRSNPSLCKGVSVPIAESRATDGGASFAPT